MIFLSPDKSHQDDLEKITILKKYIGSLHNVIVCFFFVVIFIFRAEASHLLLFTIQIQSLLKLVGGMLTLIQLGKRSLVLRLSNYFMYDASRKKKIDPSAFPFNQKNQLSITVGLSINAILICT